MTVPQGLGFTLDVLVQQSKRFSTALPKLPQADSGIYHIDSSEGAQLMSKADALQCQAEKFFQAGNYEEALGYFSKAILHAIQVRKNCIQLGVLFLGRCKVFTELKEYDRAFADANLALSCLPTWTKVLLQIQRLNILDGDFLKAIDGLHIMVNLTGTTKPSLIEGFLNILLCAAPVYPDAYEELGPFIHTIETQRWQNVIASLWKDRHVSALGGLLTNPNTSPILDAISTKDINIFDGMFACLPFWKDWGERLVIKLLHSGASHRSVCPMSNYPCHAALNIALKTGSFALFGAVHKYSDSSTVQIANDNGDHLIHLACRDKGQHKSQAIRELLSLKVGVNCRDKDGILAHDLLEHHDPDAKLIRECFKDTHNDDTSVPKTRGPEHLASPAAKQTNSNRDPPLVLPAVYRSWSIEHVQMWLDERDLSHLKSTFHDVDGLMLEELVTIKQTAPQAFVRIIGKHLKLSILDQIKLITALGNLPS